MENEANLICLTVIATNDRAVINTWHTAFKSFFADETVIAVPSHIANP